MNAASGPENGQGGDVCSQFKLGFKPNCELGHSVFVIGCSEKKS